MTKSNLISCIIPAFNAESFVGEAIESVLGQTYKPVEVIAVDDGSTDHTADVIRLYGTEVTCLLQSHLGTARAKNVGVRAAHGPYIAFLDADDVWHHDKLTRQMAWLAQRPKIDLCFTQYRNFWIPALSEEEKRHQGRSLSQPSSGWSIPTLLARREVFERFGLFDEDEGKRPQDMIWVLRAAKQGAIVDVMPEVLMDRRLHRENLSREWAIDDDFFELLKAWRDYRRTRSKADDEC